MELIKGYRFGLPLVKRVGFHKDKKTHRVLWHAHPCVECHFVIKGRFAWELQDNPQPCIVPGGTFVVLPPRSLHRALDEDGAPSERLAIICERPTRQTTAGSSYDVQTANYLFNRLLEVTATPRPISRTLDFLLRQLIAAMKSFDPLSKEAKLKMKILHEHILLEAVLSLNAADSFPRDGSVIPKICTWIREHLAEDIDVDGLVKLSGYGRSRFFDLFLGETGLTPRDYLMRTRIEHACRLLVEKPDAPVGEIAGLCGFHSASHFAIAFRRNVGKSPRDFRRGTQRG